MAKIYFSESLSYVRQYVYLLEDLTTAGHYYELKGNNHHDMDAGQYKDCNCYFTWTLVSHRSKVKYDHVGGDSL